jgi:histidinol-phosphate/aromatic aminotransferase/cobyric acid decarboxylase-like protein
MQLKPFLLDAWLDQYEHDIEFNLAASTGPTWTVNDILARADDETRHRFLNHNLVYGRPAGADSLRQAIAEMQSVPVESVQIVTGASEALVALMWLAAEPGANVIIPLPGFTTFSALSESLGVENANGPRVGISAGIMDLKKAVHTNAKYSFATKVSR